MRTDLEQLLRDAYPQEDIAVPDPSDLWDAGQSRRTRRRALAVGAVAAAVVAVLVGVTVATSLVRSDGDAPFISGTATVELPTDPVAVGDLPVMTAGDLDGQVLVTAEAHDQNLLTYHDAESSVSVPSPVAPGDPLHRLVRRGNDLVFYGGDTLYASDANVDADPRPIVESDSFAVFVPAAEPDRVWVQPGRTDRTPRPIWQVDVEGNTTVEPVEAPGGNIVAATTSGVVLQERNGLHVWDPRTGQTIARVDGPFPMGTHEDHLAWCNAPCDQIHLTDVATGRDHVIARIEGTGAFHGYSGTLAPDGRLLAATVCRTSDSDTQTCGIVVIDLANGHARVAGFGAVPPSAHLAWSRDSTLVGVSLNDDHLGTYRPDGDGPVLRNDIPLEHSVHGLAVVETSPSG